MFRSSLQPVIHTRCPHLPPFIPDFFHILQNFIHTRGIFCNFFIWLFLCFSAFPRQKTHHSPQKHPQQADPFSRRKSRGVVGDRHPVFPTYQSTAQKRRVNFLCHDLSPVHFDLQMTVVRDRCDQIAVLLHLDTATDLVSLCCVPIRCECGPVPSYH